MMYIVVDNKVCQKIPLSGDFPGNDCIPGMNGGGEQTNKTKTKTKIFCLRSNILELKGLQLGSKLKII